MKDKLKLFSSPFIPSTANALSSSQTFQNVAKKMAQIEKQFGNKALAFSSKNKIYVDGVLAYIASLIA